MNPDASTEDVYEERIARFLELAQAAQEAADRAIRPTLQETYAHIAQHWLELAQMAEATLDLNRKLLATLGDLPGDRGEEPLH